VIRRFLHNPLAQALLILVVSAALGALVNAARPKPVPWDSKPAFDILPHLPLAESLEAFDAGDCLFIDARPVEFFQQGHILNAISVPLTAPEAEVLDAVQKDHPYRRLIIYCEDENCDAADAMARRMKRMGYANLFVLEGGWLAWSKANLPAQ